MVFRKAWVQLAPSPMFVLSFVQSKVVPGAPSAEALQWLNPQQTKCKSEEPRVDDINPALPQ